MQRKNIWNFETNQQGGWIVPTRAKFDEPVEFPDWSVFGSFSRFDSDSKFGSYSKFGSDCTVEGVKLIKMFQLQNLDGSGRMINIIKHRDGILIRAGCFLGTADEFCTKAESEGKYLYSEMIRNICLTLDNYYK